MADLRQQTVDTYNKSAKELAEYSHGIGTRKKYINRAFNLAGSPKNARVLEVGCGDGRDATEILKHTDNYLGFDIARKAVELAKQSLP